MPDLTRVAMITGASAGVGRALTRALAGPDRRLGLIARGMDGLVAAQREVAAAGGEALIFPVDVADAAAVEGAASMLEEQYGPIDLWINNAMVSVFSPVHQMTAAEYRRVTEVTYLGVVHGTLAALTRMRRRDQGSIIQIGSALAYRGIPLQSAYCAAKHAIQGLSESLRCELLHDNSRIHLGLIHLPAVNTPQFGWVRSRLPRAAQPVPPIFQPELVAEAVLYAVHHRCREIHLCLSTMLAITGNKLAPALLDHYLARTGYDSQQLPTPEDPERPDNLWRPVPGDHGARGAFTARAHSQCFGWWMTRHAGMVALASALVLALALAWRASGKQATAPRP